jgi:hypothetical protein
MSTSSSNPYASPATPVSADPTTKAGVWRDGDYLVIRRKQHTLPDRCVLCNSEAHGRRVRVKLAKIAGTGWFSSAMIENSSTVVRVGLCSFHSKRRRRGLFFRWLSMPAVFILMISVFAASVALRLNLSFPIMSVLEFTILAIGAIGQVYGMTIARIPLTPVKIDRSFVWIRGVSPGYLAAAPEIPAPANG